MDGENAALVGDESLLVRHELWLADSDPAVRWTTSQLFWVSGRDGSAAPRDFMLESVDNSCTVVDIEPEASIDEPIVAEVLS